MATNCILGCGRIGLRVPAKVIDQHCRAYMRDGKPTLRNELIHDGDYTIMVRYQAEFRDVVNCYLMAVNVSSFGRLQWVMSRWLAKTPAAKHKTPRRKLMRRYQSTVDTEHGERACLQVAEERGKGKRLRVARFGGIPLKWKRQVVLVGQQPQRYRTGRHELAKGLVTDKYKMCDSTVKI